MSKKTVAKPRSTIVFNMPKKGARADTPQGAPSVIPTDGKARIIGG